MDQLKDATWPGDEPGGTGHPDSFSVDDFLRELEAKERDLHISSDLDIEIEESVFDAIPDFLAADLAASQVRAIEPSFSEDLREREAEVRELESKVSVLQSEISAKESARVELVEMLRRRQTDFDNFKRRVERDRDEQQAGSVAALVKGLLPVLDNLGRALQFAEPVVPGRSPEFRQFYEGIELVSRQMLDTVGALGVEVIPAVGEVFDPTVHEAVAVETGTEFPANTVIEEMIRGYRLGDLVIRASMVKVAGAPAEETVWTEVADSPEEAPDDDILDLGDGF
jgi:molecular chaperone GrpE